MINNKGEKMICVYCKKGLKPFTTSKHSDWNTRNSHKKCWKENKDIEIFKKNFFN
jgi:hypothetical protein